MVLQKRLDYGFNGYQVPAMPRGSRSARGKRSCRREVDGNQMCAFDLLATVAGKLLLEKESSPTPTIKQEKQDEEKLFKQEPCDQGSCDESTIASKVSLQRHGQNCAPKEYSHAHDDLTVGCASVITKSNGPENTCAEGLIVEKSLELGNFPGTIHGKCQVEKGFPGSAESRDGKVEGQTGRQFETEQKSAINGMGLDSCSSEEPVELDTKPPPLVSSDSSVEVPLYGNHIPCSSFARYQDDAKVVSRDDDENSSGCTQPSTITSKAFRPPCVGDRRIRKQLATKHRKVSPKLLRDGELSNTDSDTKPVFRSRKTCYTRQRTQRCNPFKRRRLFESRSMSTSDGGISSEGISNSPEKIINGEVTGSSPTMHRACAASSPVAGQKSSFENGDLHVKLNIKSFRVPELFIEIPETATVGSLKRTVMEAVTAVLGGGLRIGVLLQGKKVRDDNKTLLQTGISHDDKLDGLGFILEPNLAHSPPPLCPESSQSLLPCDTTQPPLTRCLQVPALNPGPPSNASPDPPISNSGNCIESDHDSVPSPTDMSLEKTTPNSRALVPVPAMSMEALAMVPLHRKSRRSELVQRRIRRPFSVSEVEALVQAVEKLGTGRWRDVKLRAFENAKHRTYVDLKDKWKTLVHTARISPQQRRGEPVPQELLDRVLSAHAFWSQQQAKEQLKQQQSEGCLLF
ncbi:telomere repeat-binding protein 2-like [Magnolia sinica]|uniref:telomere repeat-binding protein 2-like n=1 Tax=Magnolia sinica TaxID=86752 RepID=UPI002658B2F1|nr:telomere repeat-binding protein 2-like [Magnolia sinica]XP_058109615.1 telomere repeat-binding protein 2-like [Magnolia sinica]